MADRGLNLWRYAPQENLGQWLEGQMAFLASAIRGCHCPDCTELFYQFINAIWRHRRH